MVSRVLGLSRVPWDSGSLWIALESSEGSGGFLRALQGSGILWRALDGSEGSGGFSRALVGSEESWRALEGWTALQGSRGLW